MFTVLGTSIRRRLSLLWLMLLLLTLGGSLAMVPPQPTQAQGGAIVNVPAVVMFVDCPDIVNNSGLVEFGYFQLDGTFNVLQATVDNGRLTVISDLPAVVFEQLSFDWQRSESIYRFFFADASFLDIIVPPEIWLRDQQSGVIFQGFGC